MRISNNSQVKASSSVRNNAPAGGAPGTSQFQLRPHTTTPPTPPPPHHPRLLRSICLPLSVPGRGICKFCAAQGQAFVNPGPAPNFWQARGFLSEYTYTRSLSNLMGSWPTQRILMEKQGDWLICQGERKIVKACSRFDACISSLLIKPELHNKIGSYRRDL